MSVRSNGILAIISLVLIVGLVGFTVYEKVKESKDDSKMDNFVPRHDPELDGDIHEIPQK